jgi:hypothetical protein
MQPMTYLSVCNYILIVCFVLGCVPHYTKPHYDEVTVDVRAFRAELHRQHTLARYPVLACDEDYDELTITCYKQELAWYIIGAASTRAEAAVDAYWHGQGTRAECIRVIDSLRHMYDVILKSHESKTRRYQKVGP